MSSPRISTLRIPNLFRSDTPLVATFVAIITLLTGFGLLMVLSASSISSGIENDGNFYKGALTQFAGAALGGVVAAFISRFPITTWHQLSRIIVLITTGAQFLVIFTPLGREYGGNRNWLDLGFTSVQPSEFVKVAIIIWLAIFIHERPHHFNGPLSKWWDIELLWILIPFAAVLRGGDIGTGIIIAAIIFGMILMSGAPSRPVVSLGIIGTIGVFAAIALSSRRDRFISWIVGCTPKDYDGICWQNIHGYWALGSGGRFGLGAGSSHSKWSWLPHADSDYIFAVIGEEFGFVGAIAVLLLFLLLASTMVRMMRDYPQPLTRTLIGGALIWLVGQALVNIAVVIGILPVLGVPLPLISSGGSAILANLIVVGVVTSVVRHEERFG